MHRVGVGVSNDAYTYCTRTRLLARTLAKPTQIAKYIHVYIYQVKYKTSTYATIPLCTPSNQRHGVYAGGGARGRDPPPRPSGQLRARWASIVCKAWRYIVSDGGFLRRSHEGPLLCCADESSTRRRCRGLEHIYVRFFFLAKAPE